MKKKYTQANKEVRKRIRTGRRQYLDGTAGEVEVAVAKGTLKDFSASKGKWQENVINQTDQK